MVLFFLSLAQAQWKVNTFDTCVVDNSHAYYQHMNSKEFVSDLVAHLTGEVPVIEVTEDEYGAVITIFPKGNVSALIGRSGSTIDAIRTIVKAIGYNGKHRIKLNLNENRPTS